MSNTIVANEYKFNGEILRIVHDPIADNPRSWDNLGQFVGWHKKYIIGDKHNFATPVDFFLHLIRTFAEDALYDYARRHVRVAHNENYGDWEIMIEDRVLFYGFETREEAEREVEDSIEEWVMDDPELSEERLWEIIQGINGEEIIILPVYMMDHGGVCLNTTGFYCPWDSGQVGWIWCAKEDVIKRFGDFSEASRQRAREVLENEIEMYNMYLNGDVWKFELLTVEKCDNCGHEKEVLIDSCGGFYGSDPLKNGMLDFLPEEWQDYLMSE